MKIGKRLKNTRKYLGLTQAQFSSGIVTESFYSRVENGRSNISMSKLIELLNYHHVSLYDFFEPAFEGNIEQQAILAFIDRDCDRLKDYKPMNERQEAVVDLMISILGGWKGPSGYSHEPTALTDYLKHSENPEKNIFAWCLLAYLCEIDEVATVVDKVVLALSVYKDDFSWRILVNTLITCLQRFYQAGLQTQALITAQLIDAVPPRSVLVLEHLVAKYYLNLLEGNQDQAAGIRRLLQVNNYDQLLAFTD